MSHPLSGVVFVLDRPQDVINVGAVVRLLGNFGLARLRLVEPAAFDPERILTVARRGQAVLDATERYHTLADALADCAFVLGTTSRARALQRPTLTPRQAAPALLTVALAGGRPDGAGVGRPSYAAVLFGPENVGLSNAALDRCHAILRIPTVPEDASLNLAQAALLVAYELFLAEDALAPDTQAPGDALVAAVGAADDLATGAALEALFDALYRMLRAVYPDHIAGRTNVTIARLRALLLRAVPRAAEAALLTQLSEHIAHALSNGNPTRPG